MKKKKDFSTSGSHSVLHSTFLQQYVC